MCDNSVIGAGHEQLSHLDLSQVLDLIQSEIQSEMDQRATSQPPVVDMVFLMCMFIYVCMCVCVCIYGYMLTGDTPPPRNR